MIENAVDDGYNRFRGANIEYEVLFYNFIKEISFKLSKWNL